MEFTGRVIDFGYKYETGKHYITFTVNEKDIAIAGYDKAKDLDKLLIKAVKHRKRRSLDANAYLWVLLQKMAESLYTDKWSLYLDMLGKYGVFRHAIIKPDAVDTFIKCFRTVKVIGDVNVNGQVGVQLQCYIGSSEYDTKQMSYLIDNVVNEAKELNIETLPPNELEKMKQEWGI